EAALPSGGCEDLLGREAGGADRDVRLSVDPPARGRARDPPHDRFLSRLVDDRRRDRVRGILLRLPLRSASGSGRGGGREPRARGDRFGELASEVVRSLLWLCFALSGAAALGLELLWLRSAALVVGATATTAASVLARY